jgi:hypothetical protein
VRTRKPASESTLMSAGFGGADFSGSHVDRVY